MLLSQCRANLGLKMAVRMKQLTYDAIESSPRILKWLAQFSTRNQSVAKSLLMRLRFVSRDSYSDWLRETLFSLPQDRIYAMYAVRKLGNRKNFFDASGAVCSRPGTTLGSEDLVYSLIANEVRGNESRFTDHPSLNAMKSERIHNVLLLDDSIGSGKRISDFIIAMMQHKSFKSWWSYGFIRFHILSFARTCEAEKAIISNIPGSDHPLRKCPVSSKIQFMSEIVYSKKQLVSRWGKEYQSILDLCDSQKSIRKERRRGFGETMSNIIFYHSVPNNIPGLLYSRANKWQPLFHRRSMPEWIISLLDNQTNFRSSRSAHFLNRLRVTRLPDDLLNLLSLIKSGIRRVTTLALRMDCGTEVVHAMIEKAEQAGLITSKLRLTEAGIKSWKRDRIPKDFNEKHERPLYVPTSWCTGRVTVQPFIPEDEDFRE